MKNQNSKVLFLAQAAMIAAIYVVLTVLGASLAFGEVQIRFAEALTILPVFTPAAIPGLFIGCLLGQYHHRTIRIKICLCRTTSDSIYDADSRSWRNHFRRCDWTDFIRSTL